MLEFFNIQVKPWISKIFHLCVLWYRSVLTLTLMAESLILKFNIVPDFEAQNLSFDIEVSCCLYLHILILCLCIQEAWQGSRWRVSLYHNFQVSLVYAALLCTWFLALHSSTGTSLTHSKNLLKIMMCRMKGSHLKSTQRLHY